MNWAEKLGAKCSECPLQGVTPIPSELNSSPLKLVIVGESPGKTEDNLGRPFIGESGMFINGVFKTFGLEREEVLLTNVLLCNGSFQAQGKNISAAEFNKAVECCTPRLLTELADIPKKSLVLAAGSFAIKALAGKSSIVAWRGYPVPSTVLEEKDLTIFPIYHPAYILRSPALMPIFLRDFKRAMMIKEGVLPEWKWPEIIIEPGDEMVEGLKRLQSASVLGVDVETAGIDPATAPLLCIGIASPDLAVSVPWPAPNAGIEKLVEGLLKSKIPKALHNGNYDLVSLAANGITINGFNFDTLIAHHIAAAQLPHDLGFVASGEFASPRWKSEFRVNDDRKGSEAFSRATAEELRTYNAKDAVMTAKLYGSLTGALIHQPGALHRFSAAMNLNRLGLKMHSRGITCDTEKREEHRVRLEIEIEQARKKFNDLVKMPDLNLDSPKQLRELFYTKLDCPVRFYTATNLPSTDENALEGIIADAPKDKTRNIAKALLDYRGWAKLLRTYVNGLPVSDMDTVHPNWRVHGTVTGRWSSAGPNMQNVPKPKKNVETGETLRPGMRDMFVARPGMYLVEADYSQLEFRIVAALAKERRLLQLYLNGEDVHDYTTKELFGVESFTKEQRDLAKTFNYGDNYGAAPETLYRQLVVNFPRITLELVMELQARRKRLFPGLSKWRSEIMKRVEKDRYVECPISGRRFYFYLDKIRPTQCFNFPVQGTAADIMNPATLRVNAQLNPEVGEHLLLQVHDSLVVEGPDPERLKKILVESMAVTIEKLNGMFFPVDVQVGTRWGELT